MKITKFKIPTKSKILAFAAGAVLAVSAVGVSAQTLPITNGLRLWLKADAGVTTNSAGFVTAWADQSTNGNIAAPAQSSDAPLYVTTNGLTNGLPTLRFNGSQKLDVPDISVNPLSSISDLTNDVTVICLKEDDNYATYRCDVSKAYNNVPGPFDYYEYPGGASSILFLCYQTLGNYRYFQPSQNIVRQPGAYQVDSFTYAHGSVWEYFNDSLLQFFDAGMQPDASTNSIWSAPNGSYPLTIGARFDFGAALLGNMAEILIYKPALTTSQTMDIVTNYLQPKWGLKFDPPPVVSITSPANGASAPANSIVTVNVSASSPTGMVTSVSVYGNGLLLGSTATPPYTLGVSSVTAGPVTLTAVARDQLGRTSASPPVNITLTGPAAPSAPPTNGLMVWLNAGHGVATNSDGTVASWTDESGNGNTATPTTNAPYASFVGAALATVAPDYSNNIINGQPAIHFNGTNSILTIPDAGTAFTAGDFATFFVVRFSQAWFGQMAQMVWTKSFNNLACPFDLQYGSGGTSILRGNGSAYGAVGSGASTALPLDQFLDLGVACQGTAVTAYAGADPYYSGVIQTDVGDGSNALPLTIGLRDEGGNGLYGDIAEILIYQGAQSAGTISNIATYLNGKYGVTQPYYASPPPAVSITSPANGSVLAAPVVMPFTVSATSSLAGITSVALYANGVKLATLTNAPYTVQVSLLTPGPVSFTAVAMDNWGGQTTALSLVTLTGSLSAPPITNGLGIWLKPDTGLVTNASGSVLEWDDQSGNAAANTPNNAYSPISPDWDGTTPGLAPVAIPNALNGYPAVRFTPPAGQSSSAVYLDIADNLTVTPNASTSFAIFAVARVPAYNSYYMIITDDSANGNANPFEYRFDAGNGHDDFVLGNGNTSGVYSTGIASAPASSNLFSIVGVVVANGVVTHYLQLNTNGTTTFTSYPAAASGNPIRLGGRFGGGYYTFGGDIAELQVFTNAPSTSEIGDILNYLSIKYQLAQVQLAVQPPGVTVTAPTNAVTPSATNLTAPGVLNLAAQITSATPISSVSFIVNGMTVATEFSPPYQIPLEVLTPGSLSVQVQAVDIFGLSSNSVFNITVPASSAGVPAAPPSNGLALWLTSDKGVTTNSDGTVTGWADQSGNANDALTDPNGALAPTLTNDPALGNRPVVAFNPTYSFLASGLAAGAMCLDVADTNAITNLIGDISLFYFVQFTNLANLPLNFVGNQIREGVLAKTFGSKASPFDYYLTSAQLPDFWRGNQFVNLGTVEYSDVPGAGPVPDDQYVMAGFTVRDLVVSHYVNNQANGSGVVPFHAYMDGGTDLKVGSRDDYATQFQGNMAEILLYTNGLTPSLVQLADAYLGGRYGVAVFAVVTQPPTLGIVNTGQGPVEIAYPAGYSGWALQSSTNLVTWSTVAINPANNQVTVTPTGVATFYRLRSQ